MNKPYLKYYIGQKCYIDGSKRCEELTPYIIHSQNKLTNIVPVLKPIIDMDEETAKQLGYKGELDFLENAQGETDWTAEQFHILISKGYDVFNLIEKQQAIHHEKVY